MTVERPDDPEGVRRYESHSELSGSAGDVVQAREVHGGVHFHGADQPMAQTPHQLPGDVRGFVNRVSELNHLDGALAGDPEEPLVVSVSVITGTAGVGKTSLALHWAHRVRQHFPTGNCTPTCTDMIRGRRWPRTRRLIASYGHSACRPAAIPADLEGKADLYRSHLADQRLLIILDNAATVRQVRPLLPGTAGCLVVITSRSRFSGLVVRDGARRLRLDVLPEPDAITLLRTVTSGYRNADSLDELRELSRLCARLPLALRIAAERAASRPLMLLDALIDDLKDESQPVGCADGRRR